MKSYYLVWSLASINAWTWSSIFHTRDLPFTEKMDYFSAALAIMYALFYTVIRLCHIYPLSHSRLPLSSKPSNNLKRTAVSCICILAYLSHISYLTLLPRFDYTYNMAFNLGIGLVHNALWLVYSLPVSLIRRFPSQPKAYRPAYVNKALAFVVVTSAATALELFDFPPWQRVIDAHALWHLATVPIAYLWYDFLIQDGLDPSWRAQRVWRYIDLYLRTDSNFVSFYSSHRAVTESYDLFIASSFVGLQCRLPETFTDFDGPVYDISMSIKPEANREYLVYLNDTEISFVWSWWES